MLLTITKLKNKNVQLICITDMEEKQRCSMSNKQMKNVAEKMRKLGFKFTKNYFDDGRFITGSHK